MTYRDNDLYPTKVLHWNYRGFTEFPLEKLRDEEREITDIYLKENLISQLPVDIGRMERLESLYLSGNNIRDLPPEIGMLARLKCLDLSGNRLNRVPQQIGNVRNLKYLILDDNQLCELPLRISELKMLRYLSVCDNKLQWLPQRPVYNYHHCEFRFWRNKELRAVPYSLWYHMLREQQTRSLDIGCLGIPKTGNRSKNVCQLALHNGMKIEINVIPKYRDVRDTMTNSPPLLLEICRRKIYRILDKTSKALSDQQYSIYADNCFLNSRDYEYKYKNIASNCGNFSHTQNSIHKQYKDENGNDIENNNIIDYNMYPTNLHRMVENKNRRRKTESKKQCTPHDLMNKYFDYMPKHLMEDLSHGPMSRCENIICNEPIFDCVTYHFCFGEILLIDRTEEAILSATFCSKSCADTWRKGRTDLIPWMLVQNP